MTGAEERIRAALLHAGAALRDYQDRGDVFRVTYEVDGGAAAMFSPVVDRNAPFAVQAAGICLSGEDRRFLTCKSLVGVLARGKRATSARSRRLVLRI